MKYYISLARDITIHTGNDRRRKCILQIFQSFSPLNEEIPPTYLTVLETFTSILLVLLQEMDVARNEI